MKALLRTILSRRTRASLKIDWLRLRARLRHQRGNRQLLPPTNKLHFGCGRRAVPGWTNVDLVQSPFDLDLAAPRLLGGLASFGMFVPLNLLGLVFETRPFRTPADEMNEGFANHLIVCRKG